MCGFVNYYSFYNFIVDIGLLNKSIIFIAPQFHTTKIEPEDFEVLVLAYRD